MFFIDLFAVVLHVFSKERMPLSYASAATASNGSTTPATTRANEVESKLYALRRAAEMVEGVKEETEEIAKKLNATGDTHNTTGDTSTPAGETSTPAGDTPNPASDPPTTVVKEPTLCIARLPSQMSSDGVVMSVVGSDLGYGKVEKVDMIQKTDRNGIDYMMAFVHFAEWANTDAVNADREKLMNGEKIKVVYEEENGRYFTLARSYTKSREQRDLERGERGPRYGSAHGMKDNQFKPRNKQRKGYSKPFVDEEGWTTMPTYEKKANARTVPEEPVAVPSALVNPASSGPNPHARDRTNNFTTLEVDSD
jgi:hypothetical protein